MDYIIQSYGGGLVLWRILNSMAMICKSAYFYKMSLFVMAIGVIMLATKAISMGRISILMRKWMVPVFLLSFGFWGPKVTVHIVDNVSMTLRNADVKDVPVGMAMIASFCSRLSYNITEMIETSLRTPDMERFSRTGPMFSARLVTEANELTIKDPIIKENVKDFVRQCFALPFVFTNIAPGKKAALQTEDMLGFIQHNPHKSLGMYWRDKNNESTFMYCKDCAVKVREIIPMEIDQGLQSLVIRLFGAKGNEENRTERLKQYMGNAWSAIAKGSHNTAQIVQQELMINSYRGAMQDKREEFGLARDPSLAYLNAERGQIQQDESFIIRAITAGTYIPLLHGFMFAMVLVVFAIGGPFTFMLGGTDIVKFFCKLMVSLALWPPLFAILNCLGYMYLDLSSAVYLMGDGKGLNLLTQTGLSKQAYHAYTAISALLISIPFIAWTIVSRSGHAVTQFATSLAQGTESFSAKVGTEQVDGVTTFDTSTIHSTSIASTQMAQQQLAPNVSTGSTFDDGKLSTTYGPLVNGQLDRQPTFTERQTSMGTSFSENDSLNQQQSFQLQRSKNAGITASRMAAQSTQLAMNDMYSLSDTVGKSLAMNKAYGDSHATQNTENFNKTMDTVRQFAKDNNMSVEAGWNLALHGAVNAGRKGGGAVGEKALNLQKYVGADVSLSATGNSAARNAEIYNKHFKAGDAESILDAANLIVSYSKDEKAIGNDSIAQQKVSQMSHNFNLANQYNSQAQAHFSEADTWQQTINRQRSQGLSSATNKTNEILQDVADQRYGGNVNMAAQESVHDSAILQLAASRNIDRSENTTPGISSNRINQSYQNYSTRIEETPIVSKEIEQNKADLKQDDSDIRNEFEEKKKIAQQKLDQTWMRMGDERNKKIKELNEANQVNQEKSNESTLVRAVVRPINNK